MNLSTPNSEVTPFTTHDGTRSGPSSRFKIASLLLVMGFNCISNVTADDWPQWLGPQRDSVWREEGIIERFPEGGPEVRWRVPIGAGYSGPAVANGRVYVMDRPESDLRGSPNGFLDRTVAEGLERVLCLDASDGSVIWTREYSAPYDISYPSGPRTTPSISDGLVFTLGAEGHLHCLSAETGDVVWTRHLPTDFNERMQVWGAGSNPLVDGEKLICIVGGAGKTVVAFNKRTGEELWRALDTSAPGYSSPVIVEAGGVRQLIVWSSRELASLNPETGEVYWSEPFTTRLQHAIATPGYSDGKLLVSGFFDGSLMMQLDRETPTASVLWRIKGRNERITEGLHTLMSTIVIEGGHIYGVGSHGQLRCLNAETGERVWETLEATTHDGQPARWCTAFLVKQGDRFFIYNELGDLIIARLDPEGYHEISRTHLLDPTNTTSDRTVHWSHPAYADRSIFVRNDEEMICVDLSAE